MVKSPPVNGKSSTVSAKSSTVRVKSATVIDNVIDSVIDEEEVEEGGEKESLTEIPVQKIGTPIELGDALLCVAVRREIPAGG